MGMRIASIAMVVALLAALAPAQEDVVMKAMRDEMARSMADLKLPDSPKPYFIAYRVDMIEVVPVAASLGSLLRLQAQRSDLIGADVRVGDRALDNTNFMATSMFTRGPAGFFQGLRIGPLQDDYAGIRRELWRATDDEYKRAVEDYAAKRATLEGRKLSEPLPDFDTEPPAHWSEARPGPQDTAAAERLARSLSARFRKYPELHASSVEIDLRSGYTRYLNSDGSWFTRADREVKLVIKADTQAADGMPLGDSYKLFADSVAELPPEAELLARVDAMGARLRQLQAARMVERYSGPVLFEGQAADEVFAKVFAPALVAMRQPLSDNAQFESMFERMLGQGGSLTDRMGARVLPSYVTVVNDPLLTELGGARLPVTLHIDDEGVPTRKMTLIQNGILKALLSTRVPVEGNEKNSGNRRSLGAAPTTLLLTATQGRSEADLKQQLLQMAKDRGNDYAIIIRRVGRGKLSDSLLDMAMITQARAGRGNTILEAYKVYSDGHEELVRGAEIDGLTLGSFKDLVAVGDRPVVYSDEFVPRVGASFFSGLAMAAASGLPVVTYSVPSLLFEDLSLKPAHGPFPALPISDPPLMQAATR